MLNYLYGEAHFERIVEHLHADARIASNLFYHAGIEDLCIIVELSPDSPFDLYFDMLDEFWGAEVTPVIKGVHNFVVITKCPSSERDPSVVAKVIIDAVNDFREKHPYKKEKDGLWRKLPTRCEGNQCRHIVR
jgi:hypothetical protein